MNKRNIVVEVSLKTGVPQTTVMMCMNASLACILASLDRGERVTLNKFGTFNVKKMKERFGTDPRTGERIFVKERNKITFSVTPQFSTN